LSQEAGGRQCGEFLEVNGEALHEARAGRSMVEIAATSWVSVVTLCKTA
jgi:hypothetical protein